ncbi:hypothetical protein Cst_c25110 [Thermoclostridium stercorarium subsp. stercorarium DSM 8532]|uniref:Uncharacterized protein n=3 Tax=Thermoclostridium stercorarium TaxID=1510 RepID=L7VV50_THES1|nr:hypothetical protein [Thermoclostridium stercorarium]AGC69468.1 hypothetical protein Cst_c25110 [Thermoclostridium stercorarium subsp. stercorarium DSM 8532]AGI40425.1 hypothetical protein Clst_2404 [Thermoclostridium stercorarium subsp. stercorarium DSM 8532]ANW99712.1 hypothetical protein CSTERTH_12040 [Thermoclostridium stercorarium subsp. thermolacticum DSM 2910]ANX02338.1 hypothetical protein CSTERLE_12530 [Thermoclostridium stercorarium subsp. leptospartum DSM 9219]UZQ85417.1 hypothet
MKRKRKFYILMALAAILSTVIIAHAATSAQPGSEFDPLVTKSYVDEQIQKLAEKIGSGKSTGSSKQTGSVDEQVIDNLRTDIRDLTNLIIDAYTKIQSLEKQNLELIQRIQALESGFVVVEATKGQVVVLGAGSEIIVRSGETTAISGMSGGLADVTGAKDLVTGDKVPNQHLLISSRDDGRGVKVVSDKAYMLIRGSYSVQ